MEELLIDTPKDSMLEIINENFFISIDNFQNVELINIVTLLADSAFQHSIMLNHETTTPNGVALASTLYILNIMIESCYNNSDFKPFLINLRIASRSINAIIPLKTLQWIDNLMKFDGIMAELANFIFEIGSIASIETSILKKLLGPITLHIIQVNISFLICPADMKKLGIFFNNLTNQIIQDG